MIHLDILLLVPRSARPSIQKHTPIRAIQATLIVIASEAPQSQGIASASSVALLASFC